MHVGTGEQDCLERQEGRRFRSKRENTVSRARSRGNRWRGVLGAKVAGLTSLRGGRMKGPLVPGPRGTTPLAHNQGAARRGSLP